MSLTRLSLTDFRNHSEVMLLPGRCFVVLTGENGAGKTNILEAISLLVPGRGLRGAGLPVMARQEGQGGFSIAAQMGDVDIGVGALASAPERRIVRINGAAASSTALAEWLSILWLTPAMDRLFADTASERRRFLDRLVLAIDPAHARHSARYEAAMRQRNRLLAAEEPADTAWLSALEAQMAEHGLAIADARARLIVQLTNEIAQQPDDVFARAGLSLTGWDADTVALSGELVRGRARDAAAGRTLVGPHRSDLSVTHLEKGQPAGLCSTGEQKALLLGIILAHSALVARQTGRPPLILLDEVAAHLDPTRRRALFERLAELGSQVWMTGTEPALFESMSGPVSHFQIANGRITTI
jgi:DNA replication and repair protein RecF